MKNALSEFRHIFLLALLLSTIPSLKTKVEANVARTAKAEKFKFSHRVFNIRGLLFKSQEHGSGHYERFNTQSLGIESNDDAPSASLQIGPKSECYDACVSGVDFYKESIVTCIDYFGIPVHMSECAETKVSGSKAFIMCPKYDCARDWTVELSAWIPCPESCTKVLDHGTIVPDTVGRNWRCLPTLEPHSNAEFDCKPLIKELGLTLFRQCPLKPCTEYNLVASNWDTCDCKTWTQKRSFKCVDNTPAKGEHLLATCENYGLEVGATTRTCLPEKNCQSAELTQNRNALPEETFDFCNYFNCSSHGTCKDNKCTCEEEFSGVDCQFDDRITEDACSPPSILQENGTCCESGIYDYSGQCCTGEHQELQLDKNGDCCVGTLDLCGNCNSEEPKFQDIRGTCCKVLDAAGICCPSGEVDECGVCDGLSLTCNTNVSINFESVTVMNEPGDCQRALLLELAKAMWVNESAIETTLADESTFSFTATGVNVSAGLLRKKISSVAKSKDIKTTCGTFVNRTVERSPKCGNKVCEIGEATAGSEYHCEEDCTYEISRCEVTYLDEVERFVVCNGHGSCSFKDAATCECFEGYTGSKCEKCQFGFFHIDEEGSTCLPRQAYVNGPSYYTPPSPEPISVPSTAPSATPSRVDTPTTSPASAPGAAPEESPPPFAAASPEPSEETFSAESLGSSPEAAPEEFPPPFAAASPKRSEEAFSAESLGSSSEPSLEPTPPKPVSERDSTKGAQKKDKDDDDDGLSKGAAIGIVIACGFLLFLLLLTLLYFFWLKPPPGTGYIPVATGPPAITSEE